MKLLIILVALTAFVSAATVPEYDNFSPVYGYMTRFGIPEAKRIQEAEEAYLKRRSSRILGGHPAEPAQIPYQAGIISDIAGTTNRGVCGGSLISNRLVLTACHCWFDGRNIAWRLTVVLGSHLLFHGGTRIKTSAVIMHPDFSWLTARNDVALVFFLEPVQFSPSISSIALPSGNLLHEHFAGTQATTSGFGLTDNENTISQNQFLSYVSVNVITNSVCNAGYPTVIQSSHICTSTLRGAGPSQGDSGGPLVSGVGGRLTLIGVVSFGSALPLSLPSVYSRVTSFMDFIKPHL
ncbi:collagenase-like [Bicyclus anynana]|uniref:Collagenase-like n=1 Tax=Bicyclus anynana TaxID=110368 RepID=A0A6J1NNW1_BICAN|nr:collagenase-like [Bicyclus anynana]